MMDEKVLSMKEYINEAEAALLHTYNRYQVVLDKGDGVYLTDIEGKKYLDFCAGIAVFALGYNNREYNDALKGQIDKVIHTSNYYYNVPAVEAAVKLKKVSGMDRVFFTNSGAEAVEGALKAARKYAFLKDGKTDHEIIAMNHSFHGRTFGALSVTGNPHYREAFEPMIGNIRFADLNDFDSVLAQVTDKTCAIILETVQGEGGIYPATGEFLKKVRALCDEKDLVLIVDEVQTGVGRTGTFLCCEHYNLKPDIVTLAKGLGGGLPIGAVLLNEKTAEGMGPGSHGSTFGGNPVVCAGANVVVDRMDQSFLANVSERAVQLRAGLAKLPMVKNLSGIGLMVGIEFFGGIQAADVLAACREKGLLVLTAKSRLRLLPPLTLTAHDVEKALGILNEVLTEMEQKAPKEQA